MNTSDIVLIVFVAFLGFMYLATSRLGRAVIRNILSHPLQETTIELKDDQVNVEHSPKRSVKGD